MAFGASAADTALLVTPSRRLDHFVRAQAPGADANALDAAVDHRAHDLKIRLEPARAHVVRVTVLPADHRRLAADFTLLRHNAPTNSPHHQLTKLPISLGDDQAWFVGRRAGGLFRRGRFRDDAADRLEPDAAVVRFEAARLTHRVFDA